MQYKGFFALDRRSSIAPKSFSQQQAIALEKVHIVISQAGGNALDGLIAVEYAAANSSITLLTTSRTAFMKQRSVTQIHQSGTFITGGINNCFRELFQIEIIVLGDGNANIGSHPGNEQSYSSPQGDRYSL